MFLDARADYTWAESVIRKKVSEGWTLAATDNHGDLVRAWTWIKPPVTGLWFTRPDDVWEILDDTEPPRGPIVYAPVLRVSYDYSKTELDECIEFFDLGAGRSAFLPVGRSTADFVCPPNDAFCEKTRINQDADPWSELRWREYDPGTPGDKLIKHFQNRRHAR
jgi:hypothetical protein